MAATKLHPFKAASPVGVLEDGAQHPAPTRARAIVAPSVAEHAINTALCVELQQVPARQGSWATHVRRKRHIRGGNRRGAERRRLRGQAVPQPGATTAPMLCDNGDGGAAPRKRPRHDRSEAPGRWRRVAVATPAGPPPCAPGIAQSNATTAPTSCSVWAMGRGGYAADSSLLSDDWSELLSPRCD